MGEIYLIRHGQASFGSADYDQLSHTGVAQSTLLGQHLTALNIRFDLICSGEMNRQINTAQGLVKACEKMDMAIPAVLADPALNEYDAATIWDTQIKLMGKEEPMLLKAFEQNPKDKKIFQKLFSIVMERWISGRFDPLGSVTWKDFKNRVISGIYDLIDACPPSKKLALFSSAGPICAMVQTALDLSDEKTLALSWQVMNASITRIKYNNRSMTLCGFNDISYLESAKDKTLLTYR